MAYTRRYISIPIFCENYDDERFPKELKNRLKKACLNGCDIWEDEYQMLFEEISSICPDLIRDVCYS